jgi:hypothetical protein
MKQIKKNIIKHTILITISLKTSIPWDSNILIATKFYIEDFIRSAKLDDQSTLLMDSKLHFLHH